MPLTVAAMGMAMSLPAAATIVLNGSLRANSAYVVDGGRTDFGAAYVTARSHAWMRSGGNAGYGGYRERLLVGAPLRGAWMASSASQASARRNVARAQAYRLGGQE